MKKTDIDTPASKKEENRFELKKWHAVTCWSWEINDENCAICKNLIVELCIECQANEDSIIPNTCIPAWGKCDHAYHFHCMELWLEKRQVCPLDNGEWEYQKLGF